MVTLEEVFTALKDLAVITDTPHPNCLELTQNLALIKWADGDQRRPLVEVMRQAGIPLGPYAYKRIQRLVSSSEPEET